MVLTAGGKTVPYASNAPQDAVAERGRRRPGLDRPPPSGGQGALGDLRDDVAGINHGADVDHGASIRRRGHSSCTDDEVLFVGDYAHNKEQVIHWVIGQR